MLHHARPYVDELHSERASRRALPTDPAELERLVRDAADADDAAWNTLVRGYGPRLHAVARAQRVGSHDAEDVVQMTWLKLFTHIGTVREPAKLGGYLQTITRHTTWRHVSATRREQLEPDAIDAAVDDRQPGLEEGLIAEERSAVLAAALECLPPREKRLMQMLVREPEPTYAEISAELGMPIGSIGPTRARCLERLRRDPRLAAVALS
ncbi:sigma-70 family RNA polymerase sigma factor [Solirubrobacter phytolaccae]|uniref:Sigma-70 family RNA polymerase sigma factor n=1 Tax=Solirubrobacter phytolaccae TaxID=1404360 RepID=A0A9X3S8N0_9ACTN|nr:sigma-70 family RNA polymerase sigma factor [Solirubrobacter phytolaccae]MDA0181683.1 sigma-70 family RNA polymerase sigma factor [Solirubrobacter phytolaccae]